MAGEILDIFIDRNNSIYAVSSGSTGSVLFSEGIIAPTGVIRYNTAYFYSLFVTPENNLYTSDLMTSSFRIDKWALSDSTSRELVFGTTGECLSLFIDINYNIYCSMSSEHQVIKYMLNNGTNTSTIIAGSGSAGSTASMLNQPRGIFVDTSFTLYVADWGNNRVQRFPPEETNGISVAGSGSKYNFTLKGPTGVILDGNGDLFILERASGRIVKSVSDGFQCVVRCSGTMVTHSSYSMRFDSHGNIFVSQGYPNYIQNFTLTTNLCGK